MYGTITRTRVATGSTSSFGFDHGAVPGTNTETAGNQWTTTAAKKMTRTTATTDASLSTELAHEMQLIEYNEGGYIIPFFPPVIDGFATNVGGLAPSKIGLSLNAYDFKGVWLS